MELETYILENENEMDLGEAQEVYENYPDAKAEFQTKLTELKTFLAELKFKNPLHITQQEKDKADALYDAANQMRQYCLDMKAILSRKVDDLILEGKELESDLAYHGSEFADHTDLEAGKSLLRETLELRKNDQILDAVERGYQAYQCLKGLLAQARELWLKKRQENADTLSVDQV
ncbi:MAG: hypothetical protein Q8P24_15330 [Desulfobacterales bacterium]|nr:hypothetical protein [Desulfobacterales bacterium]